MPRPATKPRKPKKPPLELLPPGTLIARIEVPHRAVPWKVPLVTRTGRSVKDKSLVVWQDTVRLFARTAMAGKRPYEGPVRLRLVFELRRRPGTPPDLCNLVKGTEDSIQKIVIANDTQVCGYLENDRIIGDRDYATIECYSA